MTLTYQTVSYVYLNKIIVTLVGPQAPENGKYFENNQTHPKNKKYFWIIIKVYFFEILAVQGLW